MVLDMYNQKLKYIDSLVNNNNQNTSVDISASTNTNLVKEYKYLSVIVSAAKCCFRCMRNKVKDEQNALNESEDSLNMEINHID